MEKKKYKMSLFSLELFYPKHLKRLVADLSDQDDLNHAALKEINRSVQVPVFLTLITLALVISQYNFWFAYLLLLIGFLLACALFIRLTINKFVIPYTEGHPVPGKIEEIAFGKNLNPSQPLGWRFVYSFKNKQGTVIHSRFDVVRPPYMPEPAFETGEEIGVYIHPRQEKYHAPFIPAIIKGYV